MNDLLNGYIQKRKVRCGKSNCKCSKGETHTAFYRVWYHNGRRYRKYIRKSQVERVRAACLNNRNLQAKLRIGRAEFKQNLSRFRELLRMYENE